MTSLHEPYNDMLRALVALRKYVKIYYTTELHELLSETSILTAFRSETGGDVIALATGQTIRVDRIVNVDGVYAPGHEDYQTCLDCRL